MKSCFQPCDLLTKFEIFGLTMIQGKVHKELRYLGWKCNKYVIKNIDIQSKFPISILRYSIIIFFY